MHQPSPDVTRVDLHLHSRASTDTGSWFLSRAVLPESLVDPHDAYRVCRRRGMDLVALTDHNTISGAMEIAHLPGVVVGVEITTRFADDRRVELHVLAWGVDDAAWADLDRAREDVTTLVEVLEERDIPHALAHPLHRVGDELTVDHLERCLLLFRMWEGRNGHRPAIGNEVGERIARAAGPELLARLEEKHGIRRRGDGPPALTGGSDDHSLLETACAWTETPRADTPEALLDHLRAGRVTPAGSHGDATSLAHSVGTLLLKRYADAGAPGLPDILRGPFGDVLMHPVAQVAVEAAADGRGLAGLGRALQPDRTFVRAYRRASSGRDDAARARRRLRMVSAWVHERALARALDPDGLALHTFGDRLDALGAAAGVAAPYCLAARWMSGERRHALEMEDAFFGAPAMLRRSGPPHVVMLTDTFDELNGAAGTLRRLAAWSGSRPDVPVTVVACGPRAGSAPGLRRLRRVAALPVPAYEDPDWRLGVPSLLDVLEVVEETGAGVVHAATPGPMGVVGLLVARALGLPFVTTHHTELARYAMDLTGDRLAAGLVARGLSALYGQAERVYVPTRRCGVDLMDRGGVDPARVYVFGRGVDTEAFSPGRRSWTMRHRLGGRGATVVLYVGRISKEKGLDVLADAVRLAGATRPGLELALVGDGPYRAGLAARLAGVRHRFLGPLTGRTLAAAYASADIFCLPSATETFGQVVLEAAASGLPVVVTDEGAAAEHVRDAATGLVRRAHAADIAAALGTLADDPAARARLGAAGRAAAVAHGSWDEVFEALVAGYAGLTGDDAPARAPEGSREGGAELSV